MILIFIIENKPSMFFEAFFFPKSESSKSKIYKPDTDWLAGDSCEAFAGDRRKDGYLKFLLIRSAYPLADMDAMDAMDSMDSM